MLTILQAIIHCFQIQGDPCRIHQKLIFNHRLKWEGKMDMLIEIKIINLS
jgi:hypothetical protein